LSFPFLQSYLGLGSGLQTKNAAGGGGGGGGSGIGGWVELGRASGTGSSQTITVSSLANKRYYLVLSHCISSANIAPAMRLGNGSVDTGSNYAWRSSGNGGVENVYGNQSEGMRCDDNIANDNNDRLNTWYVSNFASKEKLMIGHSINRNSVGVGNAPRRGEAVGKWANTSSALDRIQINNTQNTAFGSDSEVVVLGYDPADTHSNNFWTELASTTLTSDSSTISSGTFTAKKYLWFQYYTRQTTGGFTLRANGDSGSNYHRRFSGDGGAENTATSAQLWGDYNAGKASFGNWFGVNTSSKEKLFIGHVNEVTTTGAGTAPSRIEVVMKWANTSSQVTSLAFNLRDAGTNFLAGSCIKVWGSD